MSLVTDLCKAAAAVKYEVQKLDTQKKNEALLTAADRLVQRRADILAANEIGLFAVSTFNTDYIFVKEAQFRQALSLLEQAGYIVTDGRR